jgi:hypothetical protein
MICEEMLESNYLLHTVDYGRGDGLMTVIIICAVAEGDELFCND